MTNKNYNCAKKAAEWWATQIRNESDQILIRQLIPFEDLLAERIQNIIAHEAQIDISTFHRRSNLLDKVAEKSNMYANIPTGYEMRIIMNNGYVYNSNGNLISSF